MIGPVTTLSIRRLNRALLARQGLLRRRRMPPLRVVEQLVGMQAQEPRDPYVAAWTRIDGYRPDRLASALLAREAVRMTLFRGTIHLVTARDALAIRPLLQQVVERNLLAQGPFRRAAATVDLEDLVAWYRALLDEAPRTRAELVRLTAERYPDLDAGSLGYAMYLLPIVQVTPRGVWGRSGRATQTTVEAWLGRPMDADPDVDALVRRYLAAFGPAAPADLRAWSGLRGAREIVDRLRPELRTFHDERGRELLDVPRAPLADEETPAPVRFLPEYDNVGLGHDDRSRIVAPGTSGWGEVHWGTVLVDGFMSARWRMDRDGDHALLRVEPWRALSRADRAEVTDEGRALLGFLAADARHRVTIASP
jgi:Winged helix DNA-binding domain